MIKMIFRMVIEAFVYLQKRLKEEDEIRQKFDGSNILKRKGRAPRTTNGPFSRSEVNLD